MGLIGCLDVGSTFTKGVLVDAVTGELLAGAALPTTSGTDVLDGIETVRAGLGPHDDLLVCSSAGGGLRLAVVGYERSVTAEAGHRVALSAGSRVVHVHAGKLGAGDLPALAAERADVVLLVGGTDGGNADVLLHNARAVGRSRLWVPVVVAGNAAVCEEAVALLEHPRRAVVGAPNVLPEIGRLEPGPARTAIRRLFISHVIGGKGLTRRPAQFRAMVRAATPDAVLTGVEALAAEVGDVLVVDVGGATTDVYSVLDVERLDPEQASDVAGTPRALRTVEGDLGVRWSAPGVVAAGAVERLLPARGAERLAAAADRRHVAPAWLPTDTAGRADDLLLARLAVTVALRRHARGGRDLRRVGLVVGSGGVLRHATVAGRAKVLGAATTDHAGGWRVPDRAVVVVDERYVLAAAGLLVVEHPTAAAALLRRYVAAG